tara:strand:+ start:2733 stop:3056 length:324 start_codon:yes stop_codon:yes gene_type:complete
MNLPPRDNTPQEITIRKVLDELGLRHDDQHFFLNFIVDFWIPEIGMVVEADGVYGHFKKRDTKRDMALMGVPQIKHILHVRDTQYNQIKETIWQALSRLVDEPPKNL